MDAVSAGQMRTNHIHINVHQYTFLLLPQKHLLKSPRIFTSYFPNSRTESKYSQYTVTISPSTPVLKPSKCSCCTPRRCWMQSHCICSNIHHYTFPVPQQGQGSCRIFMANFYNTYRLSTIFVSNFSNSLDLKTIFPDQVRAQSHTHTF